MAKLFLPIDSAKEHAEELGRFVAHWALVEQSLVSVMQWLLDINQPRAQLLYLESSALGMKINLLKRLTHSFVEPCDERDTLLSLLNDAQALSATRNEYVHGTWAAHKGFRNTTLQEMTLMHGTAPSDTRKRVKQPLTITAAKIRADIGKVDALVLRFQSFAVGGRLKLTISAKPLI